MKNRVASPPRRRIVAVEQTTLALRPRLRLGPATAVWRQRVVAVNLVLAAAAVLLFVISIGIGEYALSPDDVARVLFGAGSTLERTIVVEWRLPRALAGLLAGGAFALSGAITQSVTRNALASPDILGITSGASAAAVAVIVLAGGSTTSTFGWLATAGIPAVAFAGALATGVAIWLLASRRGMDTFRLVLAGIIVTALLTAFRQWLMIKADLNNATAAQTWLTGSLAGASYASVTPLAIAVAAAIPALIWIAFQLGAMSLGPDTARGLGVRVSRAETGMLVVAVALAAVAVSATGPIGFVAFVAPQVAQRLCATPTPPLTGSLLCGALIVLGGDVAARTLVPTELPVGIFTSVIGGVFLIYLLIRINQRTTL